ncbi:methyl-accepting chemotaxis protein [Clostridium aminobutyricum]|uniref:HAMP domain-containing protein n=1 Tax=Clostridium aminobutyricum TaxID=33953 RepID=A0A939IHN5_CLOAM|nr:methyl-accepting chemotaxis protein [Clostridium aminobutyricum]MBN7772211.1 HAMP domain-containing protein [Clostridium aminobutyricum]
MRGIRKKIILNTTIITVILAIVTSIVLSITANLLIDDSMKQTLAPFAKTASKSVESNLHLMSDRIALISQNEIFKNTEATKTEIQGVLDNAASGIEFTWLAIYNNDGALISGSKNSPSMISDRKMYRLMNDTQNIVIDDPEASDNGLEINVGKPIVSGESIIYYLVGSYKYDVLNDIISNIQIGHNYSALIVNRDGLVVAHSNTAIVTQQVSDLFHNDEQMMTLMQQIKEGLTGSKAVHINNTDTVVAYSPVNGANWSLVITVPKSEFMATAISAIEINALILLVLLATSLLITIRFSGRISKSLGNVTARIKKLADGDLSSSVDILHTQDETETLSISLKNTISDINGYVYKLTHALEQLSNGNADILVDGNFSGDFIVMKDALNNIITYLNNILSYLKQTSSDLSHSTRKVADNAMMVKNATENQFDAIRRLEEETEAISRGAAAIDQNAAETQNLMQTASEQLHSGKEQMNNTLMAMEDIRINANDITSITKLMEDIAFQTNVLALNAAVEAVRAGSSGSGFAIVANEVRRLASQSAESAKQTASMIEQTQKSINAGADYALKTSEIIEQVTDISQNISNIADSLAYSAQGTHEALGKVAKDINSISQFAQDNLESSSALAEQSQEMAHKAENLYEMSSRFKLREDVNVRYLND